MLLYLYAYPNCSCKFVWIWIYDMWSMVCFAIILFEIIHHKTLLTLVTMVMDNDDEIVPQGKCSFVAKHYNVNLLVTSTHITHAHVQIYPFQYIHNYPHRGAPLFDYASHQDLFSCTSSWGKKRLVVYKVTCHGVMLQSNKNCH